MHILENEINDEFEWFLDDIKDPDFTVGHYMSETDYEDDYGNDDIDEAICILEERIINYLRINHPNKFVVSSGWSVIVMTPERARESRFSETTIKNHLVTDKEFEDE